MFFGFVEFRLICRDSGCFYVGIDISYVSGYYYMWDRERGGL